MGYKRQAVKVRPPGSDSDRPLFGLLRRARRPFLVWILPPALMLALCLAGLHFCRSYVEDSGRCCVGEPRLLLPEGLPPEWKKALEKEISPYAAFAKGDRTLDDSLLQKIADGYRRCPWVKDVAWIKRQFPGEIVAKIELRYPGAVVEVKAGRRTAYYLVGRDGVRLPRVYKRWPVPGLNVPCITGVQVGPPLPGELWREKSITDSIQIVGLMKTSEIIKNAVRIRNVDVTNFGGRVDRNESEFLLSDRNDCVFEWGRAPDTAKPGERPVEAKLAEMERVIVEGKLARGRRIPLRFARRPSLSRRRRTDGTSS